MARTGITRDQVWNAADAIKARGLEPTISLVRGELNDNGSFTTISQHLASWREARLTAKNDEISMPKTVEDAALTAISAIWNICRNEADERVKAVEQKAEDAAKAHAAKITEYTGEIGKLEEVVAELDKQVEQHATRADQAEKKLTALDSELATTKRLYAELLASIKQPAGKEPKGADTKPARTAKTKAEPGSTPA
jgi:colicin import membrane protein